MAYLRARRLHTHALEEWKRNQTGGQVEQALRAKEEEARLHRDKVAHRVAAEDKTNAKVLSAFACKPRSSAAPPSAAPPAYAGQGSKLSKLVQRCSPRKQPSKLGAGAGKAAAPAAGGAGAGGVSRWSLALAKRASMKATEAEVSAAPASAAGGPGASPDFRRGAIGRKSCAQMRRDARAEAAAETRRGGRLGPAGDDAIDNELLVTALAKDMLGDGLQDGAASQMAEEYGKNARALLDA